MHGVGKLVWVGLILVGIVAGGCGGGSGPSPVSRELEEAFEGLKSEDAEVRRGAVDTLMQYADARAVGPLTEALKDQDLDVRVKAAKALGAIRDAETVPALIEALNDEMASVRVAAAESLGMIGDEEAVDALTTLSESDPDVQVVVSSKWALQAIKERQESAE